ncbi:MAG: 23S rRNA (uracil(1939)-C(5))-methyltransferase RlmD [Ruminococcus sp.]|nr:23S rRNA (uracil(1939)-C(5))-methyltransferase RlmD [Ruminococcus sp.]
MELKKNDIIKLNITSMTAQGSAVGKTADGIVVFVPCAAVGDELEVKILKTKKTYAYGKIERIISPSKSRIEPDCPHFPKCGGCVYRHIDYNSEKEIKFNRVKDAVERIGGLKNVRINEVVSNDKTDRYRNKAQLPAGNTSDGIELGFYALHSHRIVGCEDCLLQPEFFSKIMDITRDFMRFTEQSAYDEKTRKGKLRHLYIRYAEATDELMICYVINGKGLKREDILIAALKKEFPNLKSVVFNSNTENTNVIMGEKNRTAYGSDYITDELCGKRFKLSPLSFYQVNRAQAEKLYEIAKNYAAPYGKLLLDLYCGTGTIGLTMADKFDRLIGVEIVEDAVKDARENARINGVNNAEFICGDASFAADELGKNGLKPDVVVLDPPRKGCGEELCKTVAEMSPERVVYVSCDPETLARDLKTFDELGYKTQEITPVDLFSRTAHIESVALLKAEKNV